MKTFQEFVLIAEATYDAEFRSGAQVRKGGSGERIGAERKKSAPERRRMKAVGGGKTEPVAYKPRKDIGTQRQASTRVQQPEKERGSAAAAQKAAALEARKKAARERAAAKKGGGSASAASKPKAREVEKQASQLLAKKKKATVSPDYKPQKASGYSRDERRKIKRAGQRLVRDIQKGVNKPASHYKP
jgi:histone H1/5